MTDEHFYYEAVLRIAASLALSPAYTAEGVAKTAFLYADALLEEFYKYEGQRAEANRRFQDGEPK